MSIVVSLGPGGTGPGGTGPGGTGPNRTNGPGTKPGRAPLLVGRKRSPAFSGGGSGFSWSKPWEGQERGGYALVISCWNWVENQAPERGAFGRAPDMLLPLR